MPKVEFVEVENKDIVTASGEEKQYPDSGDDASD